MRVPVKWLREYVDVDLSPEEIARHFMEIGFDVEESAPVGGDVCLVLDVPSNRPDCLGLVGLARELAAAVRRPLRIPDPKAPEGGGPIAPAFSVQVESPSDCPRYVARLIRGVRVGPSPDWLRARLAAVGLAPVNNVVDVTNYVLFECGQPLHAFDAVRLHGGRIVVRRGGAGEKLVAINGRELQVGPDVLVIADGAGPVAVAGVMGGKASEITVATRDVLLESAQFNPVAVRRGGRLTGVASESSYRFERGVSFEAVAWASRRAAALMAELAGGTPAPGCLDVAAGRPEKRSLVLRRSRCERMLGVTCEREAVSFLLTSIGCDVRGPAAADGDAVEVQVPDYRRDLVREADLVEEVARLSGYVKIPTTLQIPLVLTPKDRQGAVETRLRERLVAIGYQEVLTSSFADADAVGDLRLEESSQPVLALGKKGTPDRPLRISLAASLLNVIRTNDRYGVSAPQVFEIAAVYEKRGDGAVGERSVLGLAIQDDFRTLRGHTESLASALDVPLRVAPWDKPPASWPEGATAALFLDGVRVGAMAHLDVACARRLALQHATCIAEIDLALWIEKARLVRPCRDVSRLPEVVRDLAVVVDTSVTWARVEAAARASAPAWLERLNAFDVYQGAQVPPGHKSVAFSMTFRRTDRTLTHAEVDAVVQEIVRRLERDLGGRLRA